MINSFLCKLIYLQIDIENDIEKANFNISKINQC